MIGVEIFPKYYRHRYRYISKISHETYAENSRYDHGHTSFWTTDVSYICLSGNQAKCLIDRLLYGNTIAKIAPLPGLYVWFSHDESLSLAYGLSGVRQLCLRIVLIEQLFSILSSFFLQEKPETLSKVSEIWQRANYLEGFALQYLEKKWKIWKDKYLREYRTRNFRQKVFP